MRHIRWIVAVLFMLSISFPAWAVDHQIGISGGAVELFGDQDTVSDPGPSIRLSYEMIFNPYFRLGLEGGYQQMEGNPEVTDQTSSYFGFHPYKTTIIPGGIYGKILIPIGKFKPYIEGGAGSAMWMSEENLRSIPTTMNTEWAVESFGTVGGGILFQINESWGIDLSARGKFYLTDNIDRIDGDYLTGEKDANDFGLDAGIGIVYSFGVEKDSDGDSIPDKIDKAPYKPEDFDGFEDDDGIPDPDNDGDGIPDTEDSAPNEAEDFDGFEDEDGKPDPDNDNDGIPDFRDKAPNDPEDLDGFEDDDGIPDPDNDGDGIPDFRDKAPNDPEDFDGFQDEDGAPDLDNDGDGIPDKDDPFPNIPAKEEEISEFLPYTVQVSSFRTLKGANREIENYKKRGYEAFKILTWIPEMGSWYRLYIGRFKIKAEARKLSLELLDKKYTEYAKVTRLDKPVGEPPAKPKVGYYVHVASFKNKRNAQGQVQVYTRAGHKAISAQVDLKEKGLWYRVYIGPYNTRTGADNAARQIKAKGLSDYTSVVEEIQKQ